MIDYAILNILRGTGDVVKLGSMRVTDTVLYAVYLFVIMLWLLGVSGKWLTTKRGLENQEIVYGLIHGIVLCYVVFNIVFYN